MQHHTNKKKQSVNGQNRQREQMCKSTAVCETFSHFLTHPTGTGTVVTFNTATHSSVLCLHRGSTDTSKSEQNKMRVGHIVAPFLSRLCSGVREKGKTSLVFLPLFLQRCQFGEQLTSRYLSFCWTQSNVSFCQMVHLTRGTRPSESAGLI